MTSKTFHSYVCNTLLPFLKQKGITFPILYFLDGHKSHLTYNVSKFCAENGIFLFALYPNATHILQPADVTLFAPLKSNWKTIVFNWKRSNNNKQVNKATFSLLLESATQQVNTETIKNGFRKCGLYPYNVEAIDFKKCMKNTSRILGEDKGDEAPTVKPADFKISHFLYFESVIPQARRKQFKNAEKSDWNGDESAKELFQVWRKLKNRCKNINIEDEAEKINTDLDEEITIAEKEDQNNTNTEKENDKESEETPKDTNLKKGLKSTVNENNSCDKPNVLVNNCMSLAAFEKKSLNKQIIVHSNLVIERPMTPQPTTSGTSQKQQKMTISTSFLDHIFWPEESPEKKIKLRKKKDYLMLLHQKGGLNIMKIRKN